MAPLFLFCFHRSRIRGYVDEIAPLLYLCSVCVCVCVPPAPNYNNVLAIRLHGNRIGRSDRRDLAELMLRVEAPLNGESPRRFGGARSTLAPSSLCNLCIVYRGSPAILILYNFVTDAVDFMASIVFLAGAAAAAILPAVFIAFIASMPIGMLKKRKNMNLRNT